MATGPSSRERILFDKYRSMGFVSNSGEIWLRQKEALSFIDDCLQLGLVILGMECLKEENEGLRLLLPWFSFSEVTRPEAVEITCAYARKLVAAGLQDGATWINIAVYDPQG